MSRPTRSGPPPDPPEDLSRRRIRTDVLAVSAILYRVHRSDHDPLHFGRDAAPERRQRWDAPDASYGVCYMAEEGRIAFAETLLRDLTLEAVSESELEVRSLARLRLTAPIRLAAMHGRALRTHGADASVVHGPYSTCWAWSAAFHTHADGPDGIRYRARHDDSGFAVALFERSRDRIERVDSVGLLDPAFARNLAGWLDRYQVGLTS